MTVKEFVEKVKKNWIICGIITILIGLVLVLFPSETLMVINYVVGGLAVAMGIVRVVRYFQHDHTYPFLFQSDLVVGLIAAGLGLFLITKSESVLNLIPFLFGLLLTGCGIGCVLRAFDAKRAGIPYWGAFLAIAILTIAAGLVILSNPFATLEVSVIVIGASLIFQGVSDIVILLLAGKQMEAFRKSD